ncbi:MAG: ribosome maturation factor RimP [Candidatus Bipolaricaulota bacterium]
MERVQEKLDTLVHQGAAQAQVEVYHWELHRLGQQARLAVQVDRPGGVTVDDCARASRAIGALLDRADPMPSSYLLEVSSPGVERPLWEPRHYAQAVGKLIQVKLQPEGTRRGRLIGATGETITVDLDGTEAEIPLARVTRAHVVHEKERGGR